MFERGLVSEELDKESILKESSLYSRDRNVKRSGDIPVLGFVTPWNNRAFVECSM